MFVVFLLEVLRIIFEIEVMVGSVGFELLCGGMKIKIDVGKIVIVVGIFMVIMLGKELNLLKCFENGVCVIWFFVLVILVSVCKVWIGGMLELCGEIVLDVGVVKVLKLGKSFLLVGIIFVKGVFSCGDVVKIFDLEGMVIGCGLVVYDRVEV